jgi:hypothetical protein
MLLFSLPRGASACRMVPGIGLDNLDGFLNAARRFTFPDFTKPASP